MKPNKLRILIADDEPKYVFILQALLEGEGYETVVARDGAAAVEAAAREAPELILLDVRMPKLDGFEACRRIRETSLTPIIMLTARAQKSDVVEGLKAGADDYVTKPFSTDELLARVQAALRRAAYAAPSPAPSFQAGDLRVDYISRRVYVAGREVRLTSTEYRLLCELTGAVGRIVPPETILENVWGPGYTGDEHLIPQFIHRLRRKLEADTGSPRLIVTRPGQGYCLETPSA
jgi:two-component system, OmpR family, KDP operon response regulator KdpE